MDVKKTTHQDVATKKGIGNIFAKSPVYLILLAAIVIAIFSSFVFDGNKMLFGSDIITGLDSKVLEQNSLDKHNQVPMWFSSRLSGLPTIDALFGDALYLPSWLVYKIMPLYRAIGFRQVLHIILAGIFFFLLLRRGFKTSPLVAFIGGVFYMLNPQFFSHIYPGHEGKLFVIAWLPFVIWRLKALIDCPKFLNATLVAAGIAMCIYTSHIQMTYFVLWGSSLYWAMSLFLDYKKEKKIGSVVKISVYFWVAIFIGLGLALVQLFPSVMYVRDAFSVRGGTGKGFEYAASWSLHWPEALSLWVPEFGNTLKYYWSENPFKLNSEYVGAMAMLFGVLAVLLKARPWRYFWAAVAVIFLLFSLGAHTPVFALFYYLIPGVKNFRACSMIMFWFSFAFVLLASLFFNDVAKGELSSFTPQRKKKWTIGIVSAIAGFTLISFVFSSKDIVSALMQMLSVALMDPEKARIFDINFTEQFVPYLWLWFAFAAGALSLLLGVIYGKVNRYVFLTIVLLIGIVDTARIDSKFIETSDYRTYFYDEPEVVNLQKEMAVTPFRCFSLPGAFNQQNAEGIHGLEGVGGFHDNELRWYREFRGDQQDRNFFENIITAGENGQMYLNPQNMSLGNNFLNLANAQYYLLRQGSTLMKLKNDGALGRISFASRYIILDSSQIVPALKANTYDIKTTVALLKEPAVKPAPGDSTQGSAALSVQWDTYQPNDRVARVSVKQPGFLRISEVYYPGWKISIDGKPAAINRADLAWMAVAITPGEHTIEMKPHSLYLKKAEKITFPLLALIGAYWIGMGVWALRRKYTKK